jgi:hypothetical protein
MRQTKTSNNTLKIMTLFKTGKKFIRNKSEGKRPLERPRRRWEDNIKADLQEVGCGAMGWMELAPDRDRWRAIVNGGNKLSGSIKCEEILD